MLTNNYITKIKKNTGNGISIYTPIFIPHLLLPIVLLIAILYSFTFENASAYYFPLGLLGLFLIYKLWQLFEPCNVIMIDSINKCFQIRSRNIFKRIFISQSKIYFSEVQKFTVEEGPEISIEPTRYIIQAAEKDARRVCFFQTARKAVAVELAELFQKSLKST